MARKPAKSRPRSRRTWRDLMRYVIYQRASPEAIARGVAIGLVVTFTPTVGIQIPLALLLATLLNGNRIAAVLPVWLTNVLTVPPTYAFTYWLGSFFLRTSGPSPRAVMEMLAVSLHRHEFYHLHRHLREFLNLSRALFVPMMIGGLIVGGVLAAIAYPLTLVFVRRRRAHRRRTLEERMRALAHWRRHPAAEPGSRVLDAEEAATASSPETASEQTDAPADGQSGLTAPFTPHAGTGNRG